jgi:hypothetical protein
MRPCDAALGARHHGVVGNRHRGLHVVSEVRAEINLDIEFPAGESVEIQIFISNTILSTSNLHSLVRRDNSTVGWR